MTANSINRHWIRIGLICLKRVSLHSLVYNIEYDQSFDNMDSKSQTITLTKNTIVPLSNYVRAQYLKSGGVSNLNSKCSHRTHWGRTIFPCLTTRPRSWSCAWEKSHSSQPWTRTTSLRYEQRERGYDCVSRAVLRCWLSGWLVSWLYSELIAIQVVFFV